MRIQFGPSTSLRFSPRQANAFLDVRYYRSQIAVEIMRKEGEVIEASQEVAFRPVGVVRTEASDDEIRERSQELEATIDIFPEFQEALDGVEGFSHIFVLTFLNRLTPGQIGVLKVRPRRLLRKGFKLEELPLVRVFALDSPTRPNPIGLSLVRLLRRQGRKLVVLGLDCFDGTPVLDIKPYRDDYRADHYELAEWYRKLREKAGGDI
jgi:tRNA-Thr(GGU) m(6)t(6)A37 methyltransferase TsaA